MEYLENKVWMNKSSLWWVWWWGWGGLYDLINWIGLIICNGARKAVVLSAPTSGWQGNNLTALWVRKGAGLLSTPDELWQSVMIHLACVSACACVWDASFYPLQRGSSVSLTPPGIWKALSLPAHQWMGTPTSCTMHTHTCKCVQIDTTNALLHTEPNGALE